MLLLLWICEHLQRILTLFQTLTLTSIIWESPTNKTASMVPYHIIPNGHSVIKMSCTNIHWIYPETGHGNIFHQVAATEWCKSKLELQDIPNPLHTIRSSSIAQFIYAVVEKGCHIYPGSTLTNNYYHINKSNLNYINACIITATWLLHKVNQRCYTIWIPEPGGHEHSLWRKG